MDFNLVFIKLCSSETMNLIYAKRACKCLLVRFVQVKRIVHYSHTDSQRLCLYVKM